MGRDVENNTVRVAELVLGIGRGVAGWPWVILAAMGFDRSLHCLNVVYPDAEMVQSDEVFATLVAGILNQPRFRLLSA